jgi:hypothetical protein
MIQRDALRIVIAVGVALATASAAPAARADDPTREAARHFQRGVALYGETDYRAALVEFKRAYAIAPNAAVLYNVGETEYQLQDYANALTAFEHFLAEAPPNDPRRGEVESTLDVLHARVGHVTITTVPAGADVTIDEQPVGRTPFEKSILVSIGRRKIVASIPGHPPVTRTIEVATDDNATVTLLVAPAETSAPAQPAAPIAALPHETASPSTPFPWRTVGWVATGAFATGAVVFGVLAAHESHQLASDRDAFPTSSTTLHHDASLTTTYAIGADALAAAAVLTGGLTLLTSLGSSSSERGAAGTVRLGVGPGSARVDVRF